MEKWNVVVQKVDGEYVEVQVEAMDMEDACISALQKQKGYIVKVALSSYEEREK